MHCDELNETRTSSGYRNVTTKWSQQSPTSVSPDENLLEALRDFGTRDVEMLPVQKGDGPQRHLVGILFRSDVMRRYRMELLRREE